MLDKILGIETQRLHAALPGINPNKLRVYYTGDHHVDVVMPGGKLLVFTVREWGEDHDLCLARIALECP